MFQWLLLFVFTFTTRTLGAHKTLRLSPVNPLLKDSNIVFTSNSSDLETCFYNQTLDHFNYKPESYATFPQRYIINSKWWGGASKDAPIFAYLGAEGPIDGDIKSLGFLPENAQSFNALVVYLEVCVYFFLGL